MHVTRIFKINLYTLVIVVALNALWVLQPVGATEPGTEDVAELKRIQTKVSEVVSRVMPACVSISDGAGAGSGVIVSPDGLILTAGHVMAKSEVYEIILPSGQSVKAKSLGRNLNIDAGMLQIISDSSPHGHTLTSKKRYRFTRVNGLFLWDTLVVLKLDEPRP